MSQSRALLSADLAYLDRSSPLPVLAGLSVRVAVALAKWSMRARTRRALSTLDTHMLRDIGLTPDSAEIEANKRFWQH